MIVGNGQLAQVFMPFDSKDVCYFASGVSNSNCTDPIQFERERILLEDTLQESNNRKFVYFSSCALSASDYPKNEYYQHKQQMEDLIKNNSKSYYIFRVPQLFGCLKSHRTIINFFYNSIINKDLLVVYSEAYRYVIEIKDLRKIVLAFLDYGEANSVLDVANPYRYKAIEILETLEFLLRRSANYKLIEKKDGYHLKFKELEDFIKKTRLDIEFSEDYLKIELEKKIKVYS